MKILVACDSFKNCLTSNEICEIFKDNCINEVITCPMADGGEGTMETIINEVNGKYIEKLVYNANYYKFLSKYGIHKEKAIIDVANCCGLANTKIKNPYYTTTYGLGELIKDALNKGIRNFVIGLGGSSTNDIGIGMLRALGMKFLDKNNNEIINACDIYKMQKIDKTNFDKRIKESKFLIMCDVTNPLTGINGSSYVFAKQKGATKKMIKHLDYCFKHFEKIINMDLEFSGAGAAGGLGACFKIFFNANLEKGVEIVSNLVNLEEKIKKCDLVITGEGKSDKQTKFGKVPFGVLKLAKKYNKKVYLVSGRIEDNRALINLGFDKLIEVSPKNMNIDFAIKNVEIFLREIIKKMKL